MSFFYLTPVKGDIPTHLLETIVSKRLEYCIDLLKGNLTEYNEFVIEGSLYDNVGHFTLCIIAILGENIGFSQFFLKAEVDMFKRRLESYSAYDIRLFAKRLLRNIRRQDEVPALISPLIMLCQHLVLKDLAQHVCAATHSLQCKEFTIKTHFRNCLDFVAKRQVEIRGGTAVIPCGKWKQYLTYLFKNNLKNRLLKTNLTTLKSDSRILEIVNKTKKKYFPLMTDNNNTKDVLRSTEVDTATKLFPPCMLNLHLNLRKKHRLSHTQRFHYSLFLKDIGMPVTEAIQFWQGEYSKSPDGDHSCSHNWGKDEKKYVYGIRHMYGLEGGRKHYSSVNCQRIQSIDSACSEGGCPFKCFDHNKTKGLLNNPTDELLSQINEFQRKGKYTDACVFYLKSVQNVICDSFSFNFTPVKYYSVCKGAEF